MLTASDIYLVLMLPKLGVPICFLAFFLLICGVALFCYYGDGNADQKKERTFAKVWGWILVPFSIVLWFAGFAIPERSHLIAMYVIPPIINNVGVQKMPENLVNLINKEMEVALDALDKKQKDAKEGKKEEPKAEAKPKAEGDLNDSLRQIAMEAAQKAALEAAQAAAKKAGQ